MRISALSTILLASLAIAGCRSSTTEDVLSIAPSQETTGAILAPVPPASLGSNEAPRAMAKTARAQRPPAAVPADRPYVVDQPMADIGAARPVVAPPRAAQPDAPHPDALAWAGDNGRPQQLEEVAFAAGAPLPMERPAIAPALREPSGARSRIYRHRFGDAKPINFGRVSPRNHAVHGVDVSRWQGDIDWAKLRSQGANFVYIKATDGGDHLDPMFRQNWRGADAAGIKRGAYHFFYWCRVASEQAAWFIRNVPRDPNALPPVIDVEYNGDSSCKRRLSPEKVREKMQVFMDLLERHYGKRPVIYTAPDFYADNLRGAFQDYPFWLRAVAQHPSKVYPGRRWLFWQYSGSGLSQGVSGKIDLNVFHGSEEEWHRWSGGRSGGAIAAR
ncbi:GH25 family lysozyme [Rhizobium sp. SGZ-381]|uniref:GH25 family lysozyme n=1 Tax=Rhizobium sp. SGZ-381 TaxID=3342800 RepID=UPI00366B9970